MVRMQKRMGKAMRGTKICSTTLSFFLSLQTNKQTNRRTLKWKSQLRLRLCLKVFSKPGLIMTRFYKSDFTHKQMDRQWESEKGEGRGTWRQRRQHTRGHTVHYDQKCVDTHDRIRTEIFWEQSGGDAFLLQHGSALVHKERSVQQWVFYTEPLTSTPSSIFGNKWKPVCQPGVIARCQGRPRQSSCGRMGTNPRSQVLKILNVFKEEWRLL